MFGTEAYALEPLEDIDEQDQFLSILYHDSRGGNAIRMLLGEEEGKQPYVRHFANKDYHKIEYRASNYNAYTSVNTFRSYKRSSDEVYNLSGIFIDLDGHDFKTVEAMDVAIERTKERLKRAYEDGEVTAPTMITYTGRGLGIFYILSSSIANSPKAQKSIHYLEQVRAALTAKYKHILSGRSYLEVDTTVKDYARVCRIPLTMNKKINRWCRLIHVSYTDEGDVKYCDLKQLAEDNHLFDEINRVKREIASQKVVSLDAYRMPFLTIRLQKLELLQELRWFVCTGSREYMIFIYYNAAKQIYGDTGAVVATKEFNKRFIEPLADAELDHAFHVTDKNIPPTGDYEGFYKLPDAWIVDVLEVTDEENKQCHFGASKRQIERQNRKEENTRKREARNKEIADYIISNPEETYPDIADHFGVSESMLYRICKQYDIHRNKVRDTSKQTQIIKETSEVFETGSEKTLQNLSQSLCGVPSGSLEEGSFIFTLCDMDIGMEVPKQDGLIQAYVSLYGQVTEKRKRRRQIPGQFVFRWDSGGDIEYYDVTTLPQQQDVTGQNRYNRGAVTVAPRLNTHTRFPMSFRLNLININTGKDLVHETFDSLRDKFTQLMEIDSSLFCIDSTMVDTWARDMSRLELLYVNNELMIQAITGFTIHKRAPKTATVKSSLDILDGQLSFVDLSGADDGTEKLRAFEEEREWESGEAKAMLPEWLHRYLDPEARNITTYHSAEPYSERLAAVARDASALLSLCGRAPPRESLPYYATFTRILGEQCKKDGDGMGSGMVQSPHDTDATYREKDGEKHKGYVTGFTQSKNADDETLVMGYNVEKNNTSDHALQQRRDAEDSRGKKHRDHKH